MRRGNEVGVTGRKSSGLHISVQESSRNIKDKKIDFAKRTFIDIRG